MVNNLGNNKSILNQFISEIRSKEKQIDRMRFRRNMERIGEIFAYEISKTLDYKKETITTPLGTSEIELITDFPIIGSILRAGLPLHQGMLNYFDYSDNAFISAYRKHHKNGRFDINLEYISCPNIENETLILVDPMIATGASIVLTYNTLLQYGKPKHTHIVTAISSTEGIKHIKCNLNTENITIWTGAIDEELTAKSYIIPGLGDAGDLSYGEKIVLD